VVVSGFQARVESGGLRLLWQTAAESRTVGFNLWRAEVGTHDFKQVNDHLLLALLHHPQGGYYQYLDASVRPDRDYDYRLEEVGPFGPVQTYGPYTTVKQSNHVGQETETAYSRLPRQGDKGTTRMHRPERNKRDDPVNAVKIPVDGDGIYFLPTRQIAEAFGMHPHEARLMLASYNFALSCRGHAVAYKAHLHRDGLLFYGQDLDNQYTTRNMYWLKPGDGVEMETLEMDNRRLQPEQAFSRTQSFEEDIWASPTFFHDPGADYWFWSYLVANDGQFGQWDGTFTLPALAATTGPAELALCFYAITDSPASPDHLLTINLNGTTIGSVTADGTGFHEKNVCVDQALLLAGDNTLAITAPCRTRCPTASCLLIPFP